MKKFFALFTKRWFVTLLGVTILALLVWYFGPLFSFADHAPLAPSLNRLITINVLYVLWMIAQIVGFYNARRRNEAVINSMVNAPEPEPDLAGAASDEELQTLRERFEQALKQLRQTRLGHGSSRRFLYQLPWYVIIGPPGSGKTTLLANSGLRFPLADEFGNNAIQGVGGTRNCDWWFAEEAVLLDTAGRYTTQDSHEAVDHSAWLGFLRLLKKHRSRRPLNGAIIAVSISDLLSFNEEQRKAHAHAIRQRIHELYEELGIQVPIYLMFTKCDLLAGFTEYFDELDREGREQVWGATFPFDEKNMAATIEQFGAEFELLLQRLEDQLLAKLQQEGNEERRDLIYTFPQQFNALKQLLTDFINETFGATRYQQPVMIRGTYFTSATQEGSPIDRIMGAMAGSFGLDRRTLMGGQGTGKSFFINRLLKQVIFAESELAGTNLKQERRRVWMQRTAFASMLFLTIGAALAWFYSYNRNLSYVDTVKTEATQLQQMLDKLPANDQSLLTVLPVLDRARNIPGGYQDQLQGRPWSMTFGLYQGDKLGEAAVITYKRLLKDIMLPRLMTRLEEQIRDNGSDPDYLFEALKVYLMLGDNKHYDKHSVLAWIQLDWAQNLPARASNRQRQALRNHLQVLLEKRPAPLPRKLDARLVEQSRQILADTPMAKRIYQRLKSDLLHSDAIPPFRITAAAGRDAPLVFVRKSGLPLNEGVPGLFTYAGYHRLFLPKSRELTKTIAEESWILGSTYQVQPSGEELDMLSDDVLELYLKDYAKQWQDLIDDIRIVPFANLAQAVEVLNILSADDSPLKTLLLAIERETDLARVEEEEKGHGIGDKISKLGKAKSRLSTVVSKVPGGSRIAAALRTPAGVERVSSRFGALNRMVKRRDKNTPPPIDRTLSLLNELYVYLNALLQASGEELVLEQRKQIAQVIQKVKTEAKRQPDPLNEMLSSVADSSSSLVGGGICQHLNATWKAEVLDFCHTAIAKRYPIDNGSDLDITREDFGLFFGPRGKMESFFNKYLAPFVDKSRSRWRWIKKDDAPVCASSRALAQFKNADIIKNAFFRSGAATPSVGFSLKPISMDGNITQLNMDIDGQKLTYAHGPIRSTSMRWPGPANSGYVRMQLTPPVAGGRSGYSFEGPWALFRLLDQAQIHHLGRSEQFVLTFNIDGREVKLELRASTAVNPFDMDALTKFICIPNL